MESYPDKYLRLQALVVQINGELGGVMSGFNKLHQQSTAEAALSKKIKELMALGISITSRCDGCIAYHVHDSIKAGATKDEVLETIGVAVMMGGGPALMYGCEALEALTQFSKG